MRGILFKPDMIKATVESNKTQTRRVIKPQPSCNCEQKHIAKFKGGSVNFFYEHSNTPIHYKPRYQVGEVVYIKEAWWEDSGDIYFKSDCPTIPTNMFFEKGKWKSPLFLPEIFARYCIKITDVRAERLQEITEKDAQNEGVTRPPNYSLTPHYREWFKYLWDKINKPPYDWQSNPWVWVYSFMLEP